ncbi:MAG: hypothetical protein EOP41_08485 [Sphingobacteriaceae bacterium]|nr:MAG: hypothetical protein EOP41_08485 [Sphingobacteriaceae bacterium]
MEYCNIAAMVSTLVVATRLTLAKRHSTKVFLVTGFLLMMAYNIWMSLIITPDLSFTDLLFPIIFQGAASGFLFVPIIIFTVSALPVQTGTTGLVVAAYTRFTATLNSISGFYNLQLYFNQHFKEGLLASLTPENFMVADQLKNDQAVFLAKGFSASQAAFMAGNTLQQNIARQTQLLAFRGVFMSIAALLFVVAMLVLMLPAINKTFLHWNRRMMIPSGSL